MQEVLVTGRTVTGATRVAAIIGWPAGHSLSPALHNAAFAAAGLDWVYVAFEVPPDALPAAVSGLRALGIAGANVTMPHKQDVMAHLDDVAAEARRIGAVNTIVNEGGALVGANTDGAGLVRYLERDLGWRAGGSEVTILGAGGTARAVAAALGATGARVRVCARRAEAAAEVASLAPGGEVVPWEKRDDAVAASDGLLVSTIPPGDAPPVDPQALAAPALVVDCAYAPRATPIVRSRKEAGREAHNGLGMLLHQAVLAFELWTGAVAPEAEMSAALVRAAGDPAGGGV